MDTKDIKLIAEIMVANNLESLDFEDGKVKLSLRRRAESVCVSEKKEEVKIEQELKAFKEIKSPLVGVFYEAKAPGEPPYVGLGDRVAKGQILCLVEAMKTMNELPSDYEGVIEEICVENGQIVEYGQVLFRLS